MLCRQLPRSSRNKTLSESPTHVEGKILPTLKLLKKTPHQGSPPKQVFCDQKVVASVDLLLFNFDTHGSGKLAKTDVLFKTELWDSISKTGKKSWTYQTKPYLAIPVRSKKRDDILL